MSNIQRTFSGDLSTTIALKIYQTLQNARGDANDERETAEKEAEKLGIDPELSRGEFFGDALKYRMTPRFLREKKFGDRFNYPDYFARGQSSQDPLMGVPAHLRGLPEYQQLASEQEKKFRAKNPVINKPIPTSSPTSEKPVKVKDPKLGVLLTAAVEAINNNFNTLSEKLDDTQTAVIQTNEGIFGTIKQLEHNSDMLETKLDSIIDILREQNNLANIKKDEKQIQSREREQEQELDFSGTREILDPGEDKNDVMQLDLLGDISDADAGEQSNPIPYNDLGIGFERGGIASGPDSGYLAKLHGDELIIPLDNNYTQGEPSAIDGKVRPKPQQSMMPQVAERGIMPKAVNASSPKEQPFTQNLFQTVLAAEPQYTPDLAEKTKDLRKVMELPIKATGIVTMSLLQKSLDGMGSLAAGIGDQLREISAPIASAFGVRDTITTNLIRESETQAQEQNRRNIVTETEEPEEQNWFQKLLGLINPRGRGGYGRRGSGGPGKVQRISNNYGTGGPSGLARGLKGSRVGFTGMNFDGFMAMMQGKPYIPSSKPQILGHGAYSAPTLSGAQRYSGGRGSLGGFQRPGGVVNSIVPGGAPSINFIEPQSRVNPTTFNKGRDLATKLQKGAYPNSSRANTFRTQIRTGGVKPPVRGVPKITHPFLMLADMIINDLISPEPTAIYDQMTGPNAMYNDPRLSKEEREKLIMQLNPPTTTFGGRSSIVDMSSRMQSLERLDKNLGTIDPIVINSTDVVEETNDTSASRIGAKGDPGLSILYPSVHN